MMRLFYGYGMVSLFQVWAQRLCKDDPSFMLDISFLRHGSDWSDIHGRSAHGAADAGFSEHSWTTPRLIATIKGYGSYNYPVGTQYTLNNGYTKQ